MSKKLRIATPPATFRSSKLEGNYYDGGYNCGPMKIFFHLQDDYKTYRVKFQLHFGTYTHFGKGYFECITQEEFDAALSDCISLACEELHNYELNLIKVRSELVKYL